VRDPRSAAGIVTRCTVTIEEKTQDRRALNAASPTFKCAGAVRRRHATGKNFLKKGQKTLDSWRSDPIIRASFAFL
jgi:hypothetical protein